MDDDEKMEGMDHSPKSVTMNKSEVGKKTKGELVGLHIDKAANGFTVRCERRSSDKESMMDMMGGPKQTHVFKTSAEVAAFVEEELEG